MPGIPLSLNAFERAGLVPKLLQNMFFETAPTNYADQVSLHPRPRLKQFSAYGAGPIRGLYREGGALANVGHSGVIITLSGTNLYRVSQNDGTAVLIGAIEGTKRMTAEGSPDIVVLTAGTIAYTTDGETADAIDFPDDLLVAAVDTLDSRFLFASELGRFYWTEPGGITVDGFDFATAESQPDSMQTLKVVDDVIWLMGRESLEAWRPTGDADLPFERIEGRVFGIGCTAPDTCQKLNINGLDTMCWVGTDQKVYRLDPNPERISDFGMEERLARADPLASYGQMVAWNGHDFYLLHIPGEGSFAYDLTTRAGWAEWTSYGMPLFRSAVSCKGPNSQPLLGDSALGILYELSEGAITDTNDADPVVFEASGILEIDGPPVSCSNVQLTIQTGSAASPSDDPMMQMAVSDDHGATWMQLPDQPLARQANRTMRVLWTRLGLMRRERGRIFRWRTTEPVVIQKAKFSEGLR